MVRVESLTYSSSADGTQPLLADVAFVADGVRKPLLAVMHGYNGDRNAVAQDIRDLAARGLQVTALESSEAMLDVARTTTAQVAWRLGDARTLPFADGAFDLVLCVTALEFVAEPERALAEMYRVVSAGGRLVVGVLNATSTIGQGYLREAQSAETPFRYAHLYTPDAFVAAMTELGPLRWSSSVFFGPLAPIPGVAFLREWFGQIFCRGRGALLVGRVDK